MTAHRRAWALFGAFAIAATAFLTSPVAGAAAASAADTCQGATGPDGTRIWVGQADTQLETVTNALQDIANAHPDQISGVAYCADFSGVEVFVKGAGTALTDVERIQAEDTSQRVFIRSVANSLTDMLNEKDQLLAQDSSSGSISGIGPDPINDGLTVTLDAAPAEASAVASQKGALVSAAKTRLKTSMPLRFRATGMARNTGTRLADTPAWFMGGILRYGNGLWCSGGAPIKVDGVSMMLTAGHCVSTSFTNNGYTVGTNHITSYPSNQYLYGDWRLIKGSSYAKTMFNGSTSSTSTYSITGGSYGSRPLGSKICSSGATTGYICNYRVINNYMTETFGSYSVAHMMELHHDSDFDGNSDRNGWRGGDSGGSCVYGNGAGGVIVDGIVKGTIDWSTTGLSYYCAQLSGVRAWKSTIYVG